MTILEDINASLLQCIDDDTGFAADYECFIDKYRAVAEWVIANNTGQHIGPGSYHNTRHLIGMAFLAYWLSDDYTPVVLAAFIHDFQYLNASPDSSNIEHSLAQAEALGYFDLPAVRGFTQSNIHDCVKATEYDFAKPFPKLDHNSHKVMRDADQLYATVFFDIDVYQGLEIEVGPKVNCRGMAFLSRNAVYVANNRFYTRAANLTYTKHLTRCLVQHVECARLYVPTT